MAHAHMGDAHVAHAHMGDANVAHAHMGDAQMAHVAALKAPDGPCGSSEGPRWWFCNKKMQKQISENMGLACFGL